MGLLTSCSVPTAGFLYTMIVPTAGFLYTMIVPGGRVFAPFKSCPGGLSGEGMVMDEIDTCIRLGLFDQIKSMK